MSSWLVETLVIMLNGELLLQYEKSLVFRLALE